MGSEYIGVCYGLDGTDLPTPQDVIDLCNSNNIRKMRIYKPNEDVMKPLGDSGIVLILGVPNEEIEALAKKSSDARKWVQDNVQKYIRNVNFSYIAVGNRVLPSDQAFQSVFPAMKNINDAIISLGLENRVKVSTAIDTRILGELKLPSQATFRDDAINYMEQIIKFLVETGAPLLANVHPYFARVNPSNKFSLDFALFTAKSPDFIYDGCLTYTNLFDFMLDGIYCAVEKLASRRLEIVVSETGWPSTGGPDANISNAKTYNTKLIRHVQSGTPRRPKTIETYLFAMFDENQAPNAIDKNFGLFFTDKRPKYPGIFPLN
ncbi:hypothetical protein F0562_035067 [Nyssa sinensis]|uniref:Glucan endo-1,3-beta-D-glucosidase n=1 Tax=Nyssa sinensis TaxID=561372 RepID=A0A5J5ACP7_9ASTE|nr:hypothetical protein F0562_035067 [Nyssa sinensis]